MKAAGQNLIIPHTIDENIFISISYGNINWVSIEDTTKSLDVLW
jgi:hypothetical protein